jgi:hypothetical protein
MKNQRTISGTQAKTACPHTVEQLRDQVTQDILVSEHSFCIMKAQEHLRTYVESGHVECELHKAQEYISNLIRLKQGGIE